MRWFGNLKTAHKLAIGFGLCLVSAMSLGVVALVRMSEMDRGTKQIIDDALDGTQGIGLIGNDVRQFRIDEYRHLLSTDKAEEDDLEAQMKAISDRIAQEVEDYKKTAFLPEDIAHANALEPAWNAYLARHDEVIAISHRNDAAAFKDGETVMNERNAAYESLTDLMDKTALWNQDQGKRLAASSSAAYGSGRAVEIVTMLIVLFLGIAMSMMVTRFVTSALTQISDRLRSLSDRCLANLSGGVDALAKGDLTYKVVTETRELTIETREEFGALAQTVNAMIGRTQKTVDAFEAAQAALSKLLAQVLGGANSIAVSSDEVSAGNQDLSQRTEAQASSLEETAASMEEMTSTVKQNADNARQANQLAAQACELAEKGRGVVNDAVAAMDEINDGSKRIAEIISVIDEIAFQTNLLALNASVEAARVGEQGRGFAVVAAEVRNLAGRSATAAKEIKSLVSDTGRKVQLGSELVNQSGQQLAEIVGSVNRVADIIGEISGASVEQSAGIEQVNKAVMQMDQMTQQNAALVEEAAATSASMAQLAKDLQVVCARFQIDRVYLAELPQTPAHTSAFTALQAAKATGTDGAPGRWSASRKSPARTNTKLQLLSHKNDGFEEF
jgi:methyl-accepting chemotaxis protein